MGGGSEAVERDKLEKLVKQLQSAENNEDITPTLRTLKKDFRVNEAILRAGLVGKLRTHASKDVSDLAKEIVKQWKTEVEQAKAAAGGRRSPQWSFVNSQEGICSVERAHHPKTPSGPTPNQRTLKADGVAVGFAGDKTGDKCIELVYDAMRLPLTRGLVSVDLLLAKSKAIEAAVFAEIGGITQPYPTKMRSLFVNLKDRNNPSLREAVASGDIPVERFERKKADDAIKQQFLYDSLGAEEQEAETSAFQCSKCKQRKCRYRQAQTRSADEPMTTRKSVSPTYPGKIEIILPRG
ncbi:transcription factor S-II, central domain-containing protein [Mycena belliarum]|uniref:Transcription factor S-II, central domain-containing protein n=1 Tax=Mycena belliarum TaxID=1033014 RepID=A0AAD6TYJ2_9AGAR|nr:transcription factor S-II, central domain-containing protein [Mycena belliae]